MKLIDDTLARIDIYQQNHSWFGFLYGVVKKYGDDEAGYQAALITYYGFLSLFPLLLVATSVMQLVVRNNEHLRNQLMSSIGTYFPLIGDQLQHNIHGSGKSGIALIIGLVLTFYGARGGADAFQHALNHIWHVPKVKRAGFPKSLLKSLSILLVGGIGFMISAYLASITTGLGHLFVIKLLSVLVGFIVLTCTFAFIFRQGTSSEHVTKHNALFAAVVAAVGILIAQSLGSYILTNQLKNLSALYGTFAIVLGLLFWIYLQIQIVLYAVEISIVREFQLWPRSLTQKRLTQADKQMYASTAQKEQTFEHEKIGVKFKHKLRK